MSQELITISKDISAGSKKAPTKDDPDRVITWPEGTFELESFANVSDENSFMVKQADEHTVQHDVSTYWRNNGGKLNRLPSSPTPGRKLWFKDGIVRLNRDFEPGEGGSARLQAIVDDAIKTADLLSKADPTNPVTAVDRIKSMGLNGQDKKRALEILASK